jgi:hypothetical protein
MRGFLLSTRLLLVAALVVGLAACMDASLVDNGSAPASITIQAVPPTVRDLGLRVSGPGMPTVAKGVPIGADALVFEVPVGPARRFELKARLNVAGADRVNPSVWYDARSQVPVGPGGALVPLSLELRSAIIFADQTADPQQGGDSRVIEIPALDGTDAEILAASTWDNYEIGVVDLAIDGVGRMYGIGGDDPPGQIYRFPELVQTLSAVVLGSSSAFRALTVEEDTGRVFAGRTGGQPLQNQVIAISPAGSEAALSLQGGLNISFGAVQGLDVGPDGSLFVAQSNRVGRFDPQSGELLNGFDARPYNIADIMVRSEGVYLLINSERQFDGEVFQNVATDVAVVRLPPNLGSIVESFGTGVAPTEGAVGAFFGPLKFVAEHNREITVTDSNGTVTRIVQFRNLDGDGWREFGSHVDDPGTPLPGEMQFALYLWDGIQ